MKAFLCTYDPSPVSYADYIENKAKPQMCEILKKFPNLVEIWYDYPVKMNLHQSFEFYKLAYGIQPKCLINNRVGSDLGDILTAGDNVISLANPVSETVSVKSLFDYRQKIKRITVLGNQGFLKWRVSGDKVIITLPLNRKTDEPGFVLKVEF